VIGCGRVGSTVARQLLSEGWEVTAVDEKEDALARLGEGWPGGFVVGRVGDNTNLVIGQVAQKRFDNLCVVVRVLDPARAAFYEGRGLRTVSPTSMAIDLLTEAVRTCAVPQQVEVG
jgi:trk system potassium uptake protein TrkA